MWHTVNLLDITYKHIHEEDTAECKHFNLAVEV